MAATMFIHGQYSQRCDIVERQHLINPDGFGDIEIETGFQSWYRDDERRPPRHALVSHFEALYQGTSPTHQHRQLHR